MTRSGQRRSPPARSRRRNLRAGARPAAAAWSQGLAALLLLGAASGCHADAPAARPRPEAPPAKLTPASLVTSERSAVEDIAEARCDLEQRCYRIGASSEYRDREHCLDAMREGHRALLRGCARVDAAALDRCLAELNAQGCAPSVGQLYGCRREQLCSGTAP